MGLRPTTKIHNIDYCHVILDTSQSSRYLQTMAASQPQGPDREPRPRRSRRWVIASAALAGITVVPPGLAWAFGPGGYLGENARRLRALENDPMGAETILGHTAFHTDKARLPGWFEAKYTGVYIERYFRAEHPTPTLMPKFIAYAEEYGWTEDTAATVADNWQGHHTDRDADDYMHLTIAVTDEHSYVPLELQDAILIALDYR